MIIDQVTSLTLFSIVLSLTILEKNRLNTLVTPFTVTAWPFVVISILVNGFLIYIGFKPFTMRAQLFVLLNLIILWLIGYLIDYYINPKGRKNFPVLKNDEVFKELYRYEWLIIGISWLAIAVIIRQVFSLFNKYGGFAFIGDPRFEVMMTHGFVAHVGEVAKICFILLGIFFRFSKRKIIVFITLFGLFIGLAALQVKYHLMWVLIMLFIYKIIEMPVSKQWRYLIWTGIVVIFVMNLFWILLTIAWKTFSFSEKGIWKFLFEHTMLYISSSPINLDQWLNHPDIKPGSTLLSVFYNVKNVLVGNPFRFNPMPDVTIGFLQISNTTLVSNTGTAYGVFYIIGGWIFTLFTTVLLSAVYYWIFFQQMRNKNIYLIFINFFCMTLAALTFFVQYYTLLSLYEVLLIYIVIITVLCGLNYLKSAGRIWQNKNDEEEIISVQL